MDYFELTEFGFDCDTFVPKIIRLLSVYPNPSQGVFLLKNLNEAKLSGKLSVYSSKGNIVYRDCNFILQPNQTDKIDLSHLGSGSYYLCIVSVDEVIRERLVIVK